MNNEEKILELLEKHGEMLEKHGEMLAQMHGDLAHVKTRLDYDVDKKLDAINEGIDTIQETEVCRS